MNSGQKNISVIPGKHGFGAGKESPSDDACPVRKFRMDFIPTEIIHSLENGIVPSAIRHCIGCDLCAPAGASFATMVDNVIAISGFDKSGMCPAFGGAMDAVTELQLQGQHRQKRLNWVSGDIRIADPDVHGEVGLFVGSAPFYEALLSDEIRISLIDEVNAAIGLLNSVGVEPVLLENEVNCGCDRFFNGDLGSFVKLAERNRDMFIDRGVRTIVTLCDDNRHTLANRCPTYVKNWKFKVVSLPEFLLQHGENLAFMPANDTVAINGPDRFSDPFGIESSLTLLKRIPGLTMNVLEPGHPSTFGSWYQFDSVSKRIETDYLWAAEKTGASKILVAGIRQLVRLAEGRRPGSWEETSIKLKGLYSYLSERHTVNEEFTGA